MVTCKRGHVGNFFAKSCRFGKWTISRQIMLVKLLSLTIMAYCSKGYNLFLIYIYTFV
ncbi:hypothetical protein GIB67_013494 [Kingdonia uniflora]|uniref:Uncharacterized protein n=1 Tax=Kingdonia uniflora TaxID=39325 RepID=A0A7J7LR67_9MAGN|nr:hypothetical protein GIB67_013494 [Kingdonia uniflora]